MSSKTKDESDREKLVGIDDLRSDMEIVSYCGFSTKYLQIDEKTCIWLKRCFRATEVQIIRRNEAKRIRMEQLMPGDCVYEIRRFPESLVRLTQVNEKLKRILRHHGIIRFRVKESSRVTPESRRQINEAVEMVKQQTKRISPAVERRKETVRNANEFIEKVNKSVEVRKEATNTMEEFMDYARVGKVSSKQLISYVESIMEKVSSEALSALASLKESDQTYSHCVDVGAIFQACYYKIMERKQAKGSFDSRNKAMLGAFLHDFGKSKIPKDILDSTLRFNRTSKEMQLIEQHPVYGAKMLSNMGMPDSMVNMSLCHHVKEDSSVLSSYPKKVTYKHARYETRLLGIIDIYQALIGRRKYKRSWTSPSAMRYIDALTGIEFDVSVWNDFLQAMGHYPTGSLVKLNNGCLAFVVNVPDDALNDPQVVIVRNTNGEDTKNGTLVDLKEEKDFHIVEDLDPVDVFGADAVNRFTEMYIN